MEHVELHHKWGHRLSHARPMFAMIQYLRENNIIDGPMYRELGGTPDNERQDSPTSSRSDISKTMRPVSPDEIGRGASGSTINANKGKRERDRRRQERLAAAERRLRYESPVS